MSGVTRYHDITYRLMGNILRTGYKSTKWTMETFLDAVLNSLDKQLKDDIKANGKDVRFETRRIIYYLKRKQQLNPKLQTTRYGAAQLKKIEFHTLEMKKPWDGKWRIVMFDIPEEKRSSRDQIRRLLRLLGFVQLQGSVWVHPLPCLDEFQEIKEANGLGNALLLIETDHLDGVRRHHRHFKRLYPTIKFK